MLKRFRTLRRSECLISLPADSRLMMLPREGSGLTHTSAGVSAEHAWRGSKRASYGALRFRVRSRLYSRTRSHVAVNSRLEKNVRSSDTIVTATYGATRFGSVTRTDCGDCLIVPPANGSGYDGLSMTISNCCVPSNRRWFATMLLVSRLWKMPPPARITVSVPGEYATETRGSRLSLSSRYCCASYRTLNIIFSR